MKASVIVRTFDSEDTIGEVLEAIFAQDFGGKFEVVVVDSGSTDGTLGIVGRYPHVFVDISNEPFGYGSSLNAGIGAASGEYAVCLSSHCVPLGQGWLSALVGAMDSDEELAGAWGPLLFDVEDYPVMGGNEVEKIDLEGFYRRPNRGLQNPNSIVRRGLWEERPFSEEIPTAEDQEWAHHFLKRGYRTAVVRGAPVLYRIPHGPLRYARKMRDEFLVLNETFGYEPEVTVTDLLCGLIRLSGAVVLGRRSPRTSAKVFAGMVGTWRAARIVCCRKRKDGA